MNIAIGHHQPTLKKSMFPRVQFILASFFLKLSFDIAYLSYLQIAFSNHFLTPFNLKFSFAQYFESNLWLLAVVLFVPFSSKNLSGIFFASVIIFLFIPLTTMFGMDYERTRLPLALTALAIFVSYISSAAKGSVFRIPTPRNGYHIAVTACYLSVIYFLFVSVATGALFRLNFNLSLIYDLRGVNSELLDVGILAYLNLWTQKICTPFLLAIGLHRRNWLIVGITVAMHILYFGLTQHRQHMFVPALVFFAWYLYNRGFSLSWGYIIVGFLVAATTALVVVFELNTFGALVLRRAFFVAASVTDGWVSFFLERPKVYFSDNLLSSVIHTQYTGVKLPFYVGDHLLPGLDLAYNAGIVATGFAQLGVIGVALYSLILGLYLRAVNALIRSGVPAFIPAAVLFLPLRTAWGASELFTALLSHGLVVGLIFIWLYGKSGQLERSERNAKMRQNPLIFNGFARKRCPVR